ncbi:hypothetical protein PLEOSDRAFT_1111152 [Pleurotus ostreatus PC15]|uniref:Uncharacterized protein n=1 Tax=Pleurotus ostreatus (strain PC15) TaxID=1137138 RepID=A0A067NX19_PLEO1|nr:hypothetical protein PLEOSDRAFT_1111152 [Pleurotus ostreatus PC15]
MRDRPRDGKGARQAERASVCPFHASTHTSIDEERERVDARGYEHTSPRINGRRHDRRWVDSRATKGQTKKEEAREATHARWLRPNGLPATSHNACAHRSKGVYSTVGTKDISTIPTPAPSPQSYEDELLLYNYHSSFVRARSLTPSCASGKSRSAPTKQRPLVHPLAQGKLLAPNLKLRDHTGSCPSLSSSTVRSPSSKGSQVEDGAYGYRRPVIETRSWSYDNVPTYQPMKMPPSIEKRKVKQMVDGVEKEVTIEVEVENNGKRLFNFPDKQYYTRR